MSAVEQIRSRDSQGLPADSWFRAASFGMFIHFDQASQQGLDLSWPMVAMTSDDGHGASGRAPVDYLSTADQFDPKHWNPWELARAAKAAGMTYAVFTAKHHSGWAAWPSSAAPINISSSPYGARGGDLVGEFVSAFRAHGLRIGLYFSLSDWSDPDYPAWKQEYSPYAFEGYPRASPEAWARYRDGLKAELAELLMNYGRIDLLWFDGGWERTEEEWGSSEIETLVRSLQPELVINDRLPGVGDYRTPEQTIEARPAEGPWESCMTMNGSWGWDPDDHDYKTPATVLRTLAECVSLGGSLLLNVSPDSQGELPPEQSRILREMSTWMDVHKVSLIGARPGLEAWQFYGPTTVVGQDLYLHLVAWPHEIASVFGIRARSVESVTLITTGEPLPFSAIYDPAKARDEDPVGVLQIVVPLTRPHGALPVIRVTFRDDGASSPVGPREASPQHGASPL